MNSHADTLAPATHRALRELLPWYAAGSLGSAEQVRVQAHLAHCADCRAEVAWQCQLHLAAALAEPEDDDARTEAALARLQPRLQQRPVPTLAGWRAALVAGMRWLCAVPAVPLTCVLAVTLLLAEPSRQDYTALGETAGAGDTAVVFRPATTPREVHRILAASGAAVVRGPTVTGAYLLRVAPAQRAATLARLRAESAVLLAALLCGMLWLSGAGAAPPDERARLLLMLPLAPPHFRPDASYGGQYGDDAGRIARRRIAADLAARHGLVLREDWPMPAIGVDCFVLELPAGAEPAPIAAQLQRDPRVAWVQAVQRFEALGAVGDPLYPVQPAARFWHVAELHRRATGRNVTVAIIDSGVDGAHPDLAGQIAASENFVDTAPFAPELHGTAVAGIIGARGDHAGILGVAPGARLLALRACWQQPAQTTHCDSFSLAKALNYVLRHPPGIVNLSLGGPPDRLLAALLDAALARGIVIVAATGPPGLAFPASHPGVLAVGDQDAPPRQDGVLLAPARDIPATAPGGRWTLVSGSSFAAAHVAGLAALVTELRGKAAPAQLRRDLLPPGAANAATIDACATIARATGRCACSCLPTLTTGTVP